MTAIRARIDGKSWIAAVFAVSSVFASNAAASQPVGPAGEGRPCASLHSFVGETQIFDASRVHLEEVAFDSVIRCGGWVGVESGKATVSLGARSESGTVLLSEGAFIQVLDSKETSSSSVKADLALYRGEFLVQAKKGRPVVVLTPNGVVRVENGGAFVIYSNVEESTQVVGLGGKVTLENRFYSEKRVSVEFAQVATFRDPIDRIVPEEARPVNAQDLSARLARVGATQGLANEIAKAVKVASKAKMPVSLASVSSPRVRELGGVKGEWSGNRGIASQAVASEAIAPVKREVKTRKATRSPASRKSNEPDFRLKRKDSEQEEKKRILQALSRVSEDEG